ncbi:MAG TPA: hypothetical protein VL860_07295 [Planctomycetota bacterium]|nr:hypothetical protein [Planctomycetota bacterium]
MRQRSILKPFARVVLLTGLCAFSGCGDAPAPVAPSPAPVLLTPAPAARPMAYACLADAVVQDEPGLCQVCKKPFTPMPIANPDPATCPVSGDPIKSHHSAVIGGKPYFFCCNDCILEMTRDPEKVLAAAVARAQATGVPATK